MKKMNIIVCLYFYFTIPLLIAVQNNEIQQPWHLLEEGKIAFEEKDFGKALLLIGHARELRKTQVTKQYDHLFSALKSYQVRAAGDLISDVYAVLQKREDKEACTILDNIFLHHPPVFFDKSIDILMKWFRKSVVYPECDFLIGKIYEIEGEYPQARAYYQEAWNARDFLYIPDMRFEIIYALSNVSRRMGNIDDFEKYLLLILTEDTIYGTPGVESKTSSAMLHTIKHTSTVEKFFAFYRHHNYIALRAYNQLTQLYSNAEKYNRALRTALLAANIAVTYLDETLKQTDFTYRYSDFPNLLKRIGQNKDILQWAESNEIWSILLTFADMLKQQGFISHAKDIYHKLAENCPSYEYAEEAAFKLSKLL